MQCPNCQNTVPDTANVCGYCGTRLRAPAPPPTPVQPPPQPPSQPIAAPPPAPIAPAYIPPASTAPVLRKRTIAVWVWIVGIGMAFAVIWAVFFSNININLGSAQPTSPPTTAIQSQPQNTAVPPKSPTAVSLPTKTTAPKPSSIPLPIGVSSYLIGAKILAFDDFSEQDSIWETTKGVQWSGGIIKLTGASPFATGVYRNPLEKGQALLFLMDYSGASNFTILAEKGEWQKEGFRRYGTNFHSRAQTDIWEGPQNLGGTVLDGNLRFEEGRKFYVLIALDGENEFATVIWDADNPGTHLLFRNGRKSNWPTGGWNFAIQVDEGIVTLYDFFLLKFNEFVF